MNNFNSYIIEKLRLGKDTDIREKSIFTDEELRQDYNHVEGTFTKTDKQKYAEKYGVVSNKFRDIQLEILDLLRQNRQSKKKFDFNDVMDFVRFDMKERDYIDYLDQEPVEFVKKILEYYELMLSKNHINPKSYIHKSRLSIAQKYILKRYNQLRTYLVTKGEL